MNTRIKVLIGILCLSSLFLAGQLFANGTWNNRENTEHAPISIDHKSGDTPWAIEVKDGDGVAGTQRWKVQHDGAMSVHNTSGVTVLGITNDGKPERSWKSSWLLVDTEAEAEAMSTAYDTYLVDTVGYAGHTDTLVTGVSFYLPYGTAALDGFHIKIINVSLSGTTDILIVPANDITGSGITDVINGYGAGDAAVAGVTGCNGTDHTASEVARLYNVLDVYGEQVEYVYRYVAGGGTWYQMDRK